RVPGRCLATTIDANNRLSAYAQELIAEAHGCSVIPVRANKIPAVRWKRFQGSRPTINELHRQVAELNPPMWGMVTGPISSRVTLDFDSAGGGLTTFQALGLEPHRITGGGRWDRVVATWVVVAVGWRVGRVVEVVVAVGWRV